MMRRLLCSLLMAIGLLSAMAHAAALRPFQAGSLDEIRQHYRERPFVLALWSLTCSYCAQELVHFASLKKKYPQFTLVLVSTDTPEAAAALTAALRGYGLEAVESWVFADNFNERLRYAIDPQWAGELPRSYLFDSAHRVRGYTGKIPAKVLEDWFSVQPTTRVLSP